MLSGERQLSNITEVRGGPTSPDLVSMVMEPRARSSWGLFGIWTWPATFTEPQMGTKVRVGGFEACSSCSLGSKKMPLGPIGRDEVGSGSARLLA